MHQTTEIIVAATGASGVPYTIRLLELLTEVPSVSLVHFLATDIASIIAKDESGKSWDEIIGSLKNNSKIIPYENNDFSAPFASGNSSVDAMVIVPCSMKTLAALASGFSSNLILRAADVIVKESKKLIIVPRETPLHLIHLKNMLLLKKTGAVILPAMPAFYFKPHSIADIIDFIVAKILLQLNISHPIIQLWKK
ncbi:MAG: hypothetical protein A2Y62_12185 [Candidatus Fischerbacteria bacterium RBG_13_37_8]|uniref:Flavin prenyltransferase UbiX n=1 Tax=Candidatus Fischerbacteria bacterium RBG_13_37_8 TaxID=1817863 RepID=A0A1F5VEU6_9BACT|nr:MAG: hypothetical protein A2Y62_12185 [Candidatus Fischerbacteria bacterium RBG_13_37_8]